VEKRDGANVEANLLVLQACHVFRAARGGRGGDRLKNAGVARARRPIPRRKRRFNQVARGRRNARMASASTIHPNAVYDTALWTEEVLLRAKAQPDRRAV
jgi:hypothetical protein